jgi:hypothetical protein
MELTKAELESILAEVTKEYEEVVKSESVAKTMGMGGAPAVAGSAKPKASQATKQAKAASPGPGNPNAKLNLATAFKAEDSMEESTKPETSKPEDSMPEGSQEPVEKSAPVEKAEGDAPPKEESAPAPSDDSGSDSAPPSEEAPAESEAPPAPAEEAPVDAPPDAQPDMVGDDASMGPDDLLQLYSGLTPEHLAMHWMAASQALFQSMSGEQEAAAAQDMGAQMAPPESEPAGVPPMVKSEEVKASEEFKALQKNFDELKSQNSLLEKNLEEMTDKLVKKLGMPVLSSVTSDNTISKSEDAKVETVLSKSEVVELLKNKAKDSKLSDADKQKVVRYTMNPVVTPELKEFLGVK